MTESNHATRPGLISFRAENDDHAREIASHIHTEDPDAACQAFPPDDADSCLWDDPHVWVASVKPELEQLVRASLDYYFPKVKLDEYLGEDPNRTFTFTAVALRRKFLICFSVPHDDETTVENVSMAIEALFPNRLFGQEAPGHANALIRDIWWFRADRENAEAELAAIKAIPGVERAELTFETTNTM